MAGELKIDTNSVLSALLRLPEIVTPTNDVLNDNDFKEFKKVLQIALSELNKHRIEEGISSGKDLKQRITNIHQQEEEIIKLEPRRMKKIKEDIVHLLEAHVGKENYDGNRLEQELIYYIEKIDIHEEQVRLKQHCEYFQFVIRKQ
ncbi:MAG: hypothetical protein WDM71_11415 [Ferruginibacter sp.]